MNELICTTFSNKGIWSTPIIEIMSSDLRYSTDTGTGFHGLQVNENLQPDEEEIKGLCLEISGKILELYKLINK